jgi:hypothetical protein
VDIEIRRGMWQTLQGDQRRRHHDHPDHALPGRSGKPVPQPRDHRPGAIVEHTDEDPAREARCRRLLFDIDRDPPRVPHIEGTPCMPTIDTLIWTCRGRWT